MESQSRVEVLTEILLTAKEGATKRNIMSESGIGPSQAEACLRFLQGSGLLLKEEAAYKPTSKGANLIADYEQLNRAILGQPVLHLTH
ncbi:MAG: winged helix-turn-helix domain-containing protein [Thaumarchaeota archaeon]|nr:winged helix-turn-helix domain-containing protein [Nitrososphaerota archaeon]